MYNDPEPVEFFDFPSVVGVDYVTIYRNQNSIF